MSIDITAKLIDEVSREADKIEQSIRSIDPASQQAAGAQDRLGAAGVAAGIMIADAMKSAVQAIGALAASTVGVAADFQTQIAIMSTAVDASAGSMEDLKAAALAVGGDVQLVGVSAAGAAESMTGLYKMGLSTGEIFGDLQGYMAGTAELGGALRASIDLAAASELDMVQASQLAATTLATFGGHLESEAERADFINAAMNNFVQTANSSSASVTDLSAAMVNIGSTAAAFGFSVEDVNTALAILSSRGISGAEAGTALKSMMTNMMRDTPDVKNALAALNIELYNTDGSMRGLPDIVGQLSQSLMGVNEVTGIVGGRTAEQNHQLQLAQAAYNSATDAIWKHEAGVKTLSEGSLANYREQQAGANAVIGELSAITGTATTSLQEMTDEQRNQYVQTLAGTFGMKAMNALLSEGTDGWDALTGAVGEAATIQEVAATMVDTYAGKMEALDGVLETIKIQVGSALLPALEGLAQIAGALATQFGPGLTAAMEGVGQAFSGVVAVVESTIGMVQQGVPTFEILYQAISGVLQAFGMGEQQARGFALAFSRIAEVLAAIAAPIADAISQFVKLQDVFGALGILAAVALAPAIGAVLSFAAIVAGLVAVVALVRTAWESDFLGIKTAVETVFAGLNRAFTEFQFVMSETANVTDAIVSAVSGFLEVLGVAPDTIQVVATAVENVITAIQNFGQYLRLAATDGDYLNDFLSSLPASVQPVAEVIGKVVAVVSTFIQGLQAGKAPIEAFKTAMAGVGVNIEPLITAVTALGTALASFFAPTIDRIKTALGGLKDGLAPLAPQFQALGDAIGRAFQAVLPILATLAGAIGAIVAVIVKLIGEVLAQAFTRLPAIIGGAVTTITGYLNAFSSLFEGIVKAVTALLKGDWEGAWKAAVEGVKGFATGVGEILSGLLTIVDNIMGGIIDAIINVVNDLLGTAIGGWEDFKEAVVRVFQDLYDALVGNSIVPDMIDAIIDAFSSLGKSIVDALGGLIEQVVQVFQNILDAIIRMEWLEAGVEIVLKVVDGLRTFASEAAGVVSEWVENITSTVRDLAADWLAAGVAIIEEIIKGLQEFAEYARTEIGGWPGQVLGEVADLASEWIAVGAEAVKNIIEGLADFATKIGTAVSSWPEDALSAVSGLAENFKAIGANILQGIIDGITEGAGAVWDTIVGVFTRAETESKEATEETSPSQVYWRIGFDMMRGLQFGIDDGGDGAVSAMLANLDALEIEALTKTGEMISAITAAIIPALTGLQALANYTAPPGIKENISEFVDTLEALMLELGELAAEYDGQRNKILKITEITNEVVGSVGAAVANLKILEYAEFPETLDTQIERFVDIVREFTTGLVSLVEVLEDDTLDWLGRLSDATGAVFGMVGVVLDGSRQLANVDFSELIKWPYYLRDQFTTFRNIISTMLGLFAETVLEVGVFSTAIGELSTAVNAVFATITPVLEGSRKLANMDFSELIKWPYYLRDQFTIFRNIAATLVNLFAESAAKLGGLTEGVSDFASATEEVFGMVETVLSASEMLANFDFGSIIKWPYYLRDQFTIFRNIVQTAVLLIGEAATVVGVDMAQKVQEFVSAALAVFELLNQVGAAVYVLTNFDRNIKAWFSMQINLQYIVGWVDRMVQAFSEVARKLDTEAAAAIEQFVGAAKAVVGLLPDAIAAIQLLTGFERDIKSWFDMQINLQYIVGWINRMVQAFEEVASKLSTEASAAIQNFVGAAEAVVGLIGDAMDAMILLRDSYQWQDPIDETGGNAENLAANINAIVNAFKFAASKLSTEASEAIQNFVSAAQGVIGLVEGAMAAMTLLRDSYQWQDPIDETGGNAENLAKNVQAIVDAFREAADKMSQEAAENVKRFADAVTAVLGIIQPAIDGMKAIAEYVHNAGLNDALQTFKTDLISVSETLATALAELATRTEGALGTAAAAAANVTTIIGLITPAIDALKALGEYAPVQGLAGKLEVFTGQLSEAVRYLTDRLNIIANDLTGTIAPAITMANDMNTIFSSVKQAADTMGQLAATEMRDVKAVSDFLIAQATLLKNTLTSAGATINGTVVSAARAFASAMADTVAATKEALATIAGLIGGGVSGSLQGILDQMQKAMSNQIGPVYQIGRDIGTAFNSGLSRELSITPGIVAGFMNAMLAAMQAAAAAAGQLGTATGAGYAQGVKSTIAGLPNDVRGTVNAITAAFGSGVSTAGSYGSNMGASFASGISSQIPAIRAAAAAAAAAATVSTRSELKISSPSKEGIDIGQDYIAGFLLPFKNLKGNAVGQAFANAPAIQGGGGAVATGDTYNIYVTVPGGAAAPEVEGVIEAAVERVLRKTGRAAGARIRVR